MRSFTKTILAAVLFALSSGPASAVPTLNVHIQKANGQAVEAVTVMAIEFGMNGPSTYTQVGLTDASGDVTFTLSSGTYGRSYNIYYSSHGFSPSISDQFNNPEYDPNRYVWAMGDQTYYSTFTVAQDLTEVGQLRQEFTGATPLKVLFGGVWNMKSQLQGGSGIVVVDVSSNGILSVDNVPYADANTYNIGLYDPALNQGIGRNVMTALSAGTPVVSYTGSAKLDFNKAVPPARVEDKPATGGTDGTATGASVEGVMMSTAGTAIPWMGIEVKACTGYEWRNWAHVGEDGRFKLYGLTPGTTYYVSAHGGCSWNHETQVSKCFEPFVSPNFNSPDICAGGVDHSLATSNDIVYISSDVLFHRVTLNEMPKSIGQIKVYVKSSSGLNMPNANVNINPDGSPWPVNGQSCSNEQNYMQYFSTNFINMPGLSNSNVNTSATGYALLDGLPSGNYMVNVWTPFSQNTNNGPSGFNAGDDGEFGFGNNGCGQNCNWSAQHCQGKGADDYRITITTWTNPTFHVYDSSGVDVGLSSITYIVEAGGMNLNGIVRGTVRFPGVVDLSANPLMITLYPQCDNMGPCGAMGNFTAIDGSGASSYNYSISVSTGYSYWMNVKGIGWGRVKNRGGGEERINLTSTGTVVVDMDFTPAGIVSGKLYKPVAGGKELVTPSANQWISVGLNSERGYSHGQLQKDGTFEMTDVIPGINRLTVHASGMGTSSSFNYALPSPTPIVNVVAGATMTVDVNLVDAILVGATLDLTKVPDPTIVKRSTSSWDTILGFKAIPVPAGTVLKAEAIRTLFFGKGGGDEDQMRYSGITGPNQEGPCGRSWPGGFCASRVPSPATYDFYLMRSGDFGDMEGGGAAIDSPWPHFVLLTSSKNVIVDSAHATGLVRAGGGSSTAAVAGVDVVLTPATDLSGRGNATLKGGVTADNFFRQADYDALGGDFEKFIDYLPMVALYDSNGAFKAAGIVVPPAEWIGQNEDAFDAAFAQGYTQFKTMFDTAPYFGFEIRGLKPLECFTAVVTTPNYPPYQTKTCVGANKSTTTITVDMDSAVGAGATVAGVVTSSAPTPVNLANALVELVGEGVTKSVVTNSSGAFKFEGLPRGIVRLKATAEGYAQADAEQSLVGSNSYAQNFALFPAGGSITGTVYTQKLPYAKVMSGAQIVAYNDTFNGNTTGATALIRTLTGADGTYKLTGLIPGDTYKLFLKVPGKYNLSLTTEAINGNIPEMDFVTKAKAFDLEMFVEKTASAFEFTVKNPGDFKTGEARYKASPYSVSGSTEINMVKMPNGDLLGKIALADLANGITYVLHAAATSYSNKFIEKDIQFGKGFKGSSQRHIDDYVLGDQSTGDNAAPLVGSEDPSAIVFPPGAVQTTGIPTCTSKGEDKDDSAVADKVAALGADAFKGDLYTIALSSVSVNEGKSIELKLAYDKDLVVAGEESELTVARFNDTTQEWETVAGLPTPDPDAGIIKVKLKSLASVLTVRGGVAPQFNRFDGKQYVVRPQAVGAGGSGTFAVVNPSIAGNALNKSKVKVFNYPNPFNLKSKAISNNNGAALPGTTNGTVIHVEVPAGNGGAGHVRIYTLAGELVKDISVTFTDNAYNYVPWDGHNSGGQEVANGVYYGVVEMSGKSVKLKDATFKMAVIK